MSAFEIADIIGIICFALSGFLVGVYCKLDILGVFISAFLTAFGGGMIRDVLADRTPYVFTSNLPLILVLATVLISLLFKLHKVDDLERKWAFIISDAVGLVSFSIAGAIIAINSGLNFLSVLILAFITAVGGGTIRDVLINKIPFILVSEFYATVSLIVAVAVYVLEFFGMRNFVSLSVIFVLGVTLRVVAYYRRWHLPTLS
jgi:uncharacterized membrane protein YeiH